MFPGARAPRIINSTIIFRPMQTQEFVVDLTGCITSTEKAREAVMVHSAPLDENAVVVRGTLNYDAPSITAHDLLESFKSSGFQSSHLGQASDVIDAMLLWRLNQEELTMEEKGEDLNEEVAPGVKLFSWADPAVRVRTRATIFLSFTSNMISSGLREAFVYLAKNKLIDVIVTTAGGIEEDFIKCLGTFVVGSFSQIKGSELRRKGWNRIGNIYVPNENYVKFEDFLSPILDKCLEEQNNTGAILTASKLIHKLGEAINDESSLYYWCYKNNIPVFCPAITDGSIGDNLFFHRARKPGLVIDVVEDIEKINKLALGAKKTGIIILGGGAAKHHVCNANLMRNGADFAVYINTAQEFDGCDSGAAPDEAISWGKIKSTAASVKVCCDATIAFPILVASVFKKHKEIRDRERVALEASALDFILKSPYHD